MFSISDFNHQLPTISFDAAMPNICLTIAYDGTNYVGWQVQPNGVSVQATIERALEKLTGEDVRLIASGRTDSGVHALGQVASFHTESTIPPEKFTQALQQYLPADIVICDSQEVPEEFHARYWAVRKRYRYAIHNARTSLPQLRNYVWHHPGALDFEAMQQAAGAVVGRHDFRCFETQFPNRASSVRTVTEASLTRADLWNVWSTDAASSEGGAFLVFEIEADGFLYNMVRAIVGTLVRVGRGTIDPADVARIIASGDRANAGDTAPACGLYLVRVDYENPSEDAETGRIEGHGFNTD